MENQRHKLSEYDETIRFVLESGGEFRLYPRGITDSHLIGVVVRIYRGEKCVKLTSPAYRLYVFLWRSTFIRKVFYKLRRWKNKLLRKNQLR